MKVSVLTLVYFYMQVYSLEDGPVHAVWRDIGVSVNIMGTNEKMKTTVDWLKYAIIFILVFVTSTLVWTLPIGT